MCLHEGALHVYASAVHACTALSVCVCAVTCVVCMSVYCVYACTRALCMCLFATCVRVHCVCKGSPQGIEWRRVSECRRRSATPMCLCHPVPPAVSPGPRCERAEDRCLQHNPCLHGGTCKGNACICPEGYTGPYCQHSECGDVGRYGGHVGTRHLSPSPSRPQARRCQSWTGTGRRAAGAVVRSPGVPCTHFPPFCTQNRCWCRGAQWCPLTPSPRRCPWAVQRRFP